ncbi:MAG: carbohydrate ABC transporter permease [Cyanobacteria bacterium NC_groundwater_1444_Ag_S-0.65um_54_12]|nr:carbohydrate ABC transporter permease [Cyanobacteria bacterium NC_groundwater_1444_Ag_S-0.65um_54_12]
MKRVFSYAALLLGALACAAPFALLILTSLMTYQQTIAYPPEWLPRPLTLENYYQAFTTSPLLRYFGNSVLVAAATVSGQLAAGAMAGFAFARLRFGGRSVLFFLILATMMVPVQVNLVPLFALVARFGWVDSYWALIVPDLAGAFGVFLFRQWFLNLPQELEDAARIDGCNPWQFFWRIALPTALPAIATLGIFQFLASWNTFMWPLIVTNSDAIRTLPVGLAAFRASMHETTNWPLLMAATSVAIVPAIFVFLALQRFFLRGLMEGAVKG